MCIEYYNGHLVNGFPHATQAQKVVSRYRNLKTKQFAGFCQPIEQVCDCLPGLINPMAASTVIESVIDFEYLKSLWKNNDSKKLKKLSTTDGRIYFVGDVTDEIIGELDVAISSCVCMYMLMLAHHDSKNKRSDCSEFYPEKDTIPGWLEVMVKLGYDKRCYLMLDLCSGVFVSRLSNDCYKALADGRNYMSAIETMLVGVQYQINKRFPDFAEVTDELFETCIFLANMAVINNTYFIEIDK